MTMFSMIRILTYTVIVMFLQSNTQSHSVYEQSTDDQETHAGVDLKTPAGVDLKTPAGVAPQPRWCLSCLEEINQNSTYIEFLKRNRTGMLNNVNGHIKLRLNKLLTILLNVAYSKSTIQRSLLAYHLNDIRDRYSPWKMIDKNLNENGPMKHLCFYKEGFQVFAHVLAKMEKDVTVLFGNKRADIIKNLTTKLTKNSRIYGIYPILCDIDKLASLLNRSNPCKCRSSQPSVKTFENRVLKYQDGKKSFDNYHIIAFHLTRMRHFIDRFSLAIIETNYW